jgi:hypothetical protein
VKQGKFWGKNENFCENKKSVVKSFAIKKIVEKRKRVFVSTIEIRVLIEKGPIY